MFRYLFVVPQFSDFCFIILSYFTCLYGCSSTDLSLHEFSLKRKRFFQNSCTFSISFPPSLFFFPRLFHNVENLQRPSGIFSIVENSLLSFLIKIGGASGTSRNHSIQYPRTKRLIRLTIPTRGPLCRLFDCTALRTSDTTLRITTFFFGTSFGVFLGISPRYCL